VTITVPCPMKDGTYQLQFKMFYTVQTKSGQVEVPFGDSLAESVTVGTTKAVSPGVKLGVKAFTPSSSSPRQFTAVIPGSVVGSQEATAMPVYYTGSNRVQVTTTVTRNFNSIMGLLWTVLLLEE